MIPRETIQKILDLGVQAPSGENAQPWEFAVDGNKISVLNVSERDRSVYNFKQRASHIAQGAVIENIIIASAQSGYEAVVSLFPEKTNQDLVARIELKEASPSNQPLYPFIATRSTNRKPYNGKPVSAEALTALANSLPPVLGVNGTFILDSEKIERAAHAVSVNDRLILENQSLHHFFFSHIHWTIEEEEKIRSGFYIKVLELLPPAGVLFRIFKHWKAMRVLNAIGIAKAGAKQNAKIYSSSAGMGILVVPTPTPECFVQTGMALQKLWLTATSLGISLQPLTGVVFFHHRIEAGDGDVFSKVHQGIIEEAYEQIREVFGVSDATIAMMFRFGHADPPTAHSLKMPPTIRYHQ